MTESYDTEHHPDVDTLADLDAALLDDAGLAHDAGPPDDARLRDGAGSALRAHVVRCAVCAERMAQLADTRALLAELPAPAVPADVAQRLAAALAAERGPVAECSTARSPALVPAPAGNVAARSDRAGRPRPGWTRAGAAAAGIALLLAAAVGAGTLVHRSPSSSTASSTSISRPESTAGQAARPAAVVVVSGRDYRAADLDTGARALLATPPSFRAPGQTAPAAGPTPDASADAAGQASAALAAATALARLHQPAQLQACVDELAGRPATAVAVDFARYQSRPALVVVLTDPDPAKARVWVVGPECRRGNADLLRYQVVRRAR